MTADPMKEHVRKLDRAVVAKGGRSLFGKPYPGRPQEPATGLQPGEKVAKVRQDRPLAPWEVMALSARRHQPKWNSPRAKGK